MYLLCSSVVLKMIIGYIILFLGFPITMGFFFIFLLLNMGKTGPSLDIGSLYIDSIS